MCPILQSGCLHIINNNNNNWSILIYRSLIGLVLPDIQPVHIFQYDNKWVLKVDYIKHLLMVICFHPSI